jgi:hypothetical protein
MTEQSRQQLLTDLDQRLGCLLRSIYESTSTVERARLVQVARRCNNEMLDVLRQAPDEEHH